MQQCFCFTFALCTLSIVNVELAQRTFLLPIMSFWLFVATQLRSCPWVSGSCRENERNAKIKWLLLMLAMHCSYLIFVILRPGNLTKKMHKFAIIIASKKSLSRSLWKFLHRLERFTLTLPLTKHQPCHCQCCLAPTLFDREIEINITLLLLLTNMSYEIGGQYCSLSLGSFQFIL